MKTPSTNSCHHFNTCTLKHWKQPQHWKAGRLKQFHHTTWSKINFTGHHKLWVTVEFLVKAMTCQRIHVRGLPFQAEHEQIEQFFRDRGFSCAIERVVRKGKWHPYQNNRCSAFLWVPSRDIQAIVDSNLMMWRHRLEIQEAVDNGQGLQPPYWLVRQALMEEVTCLHHLWYTTWLQLCETNWSFFAWTFLWDRSGYLIYSLDSFTCLIWISPEMSCKLSIMMLNMQAGCLSSCFDQDVPQLG